MGKNESPKINRMPITVIVNNQPQNFWTSYELEKGNIDANCIKCGEFKQTEIQVPKNIEVDSDDKNIQNEVISKLKDLVQRVEIGMAVCEGCFDQDFIDNRPTLYIDVLERVQKEMGFCIDFEEQRKSILGNI